MSATKNASKVPGSKISPTVATNRLHLSPRPIRIPGSHIWVCSILLTPKIAQDWIEKHNNRNRKHREHKIEQYAKVMAAGKWYETHQGIAFDDEGELVSGGHRAEAVIRSGVAIQTLVFIHCTPEEEREAVDQATMRTARDVGSLAHGDEVSVLMQATAMSMLYGRHGRRGHHRLTPQETYELVVTHRPILNLVLGAVTHKVRGLITAGTLGPICRAAYSCKKVDIVNFVDVLCSGVPKLEGDRVIIDLRTLILSRRQDFLGSLGINKLYGLVEKAVHIYMTGEQYLGKIKPEADDIYGLPGTKQV